MASPVDVLPARLFALVAVPFVLGLSLLALLFKLGPTAWALVLTVVFGGIFVVVIVGARWVLMEKQQGSPESGSE